MAIVCFDSAITFGPVKLRYKPETLEYVVARVETRSHTSRIINVYRPGGKVATSMFFSELEKLIKKVQYANEDVILCGDMNVALNRKTTNATVMKDLLNRCGLQQNVARATHEKGGLLDLVCSQNKTSVKVTDFNLPSDHCLLTWLPFAPPKKRK